MYRILVISIPILISLSGFSQKTDTAKAIRNLQKYFLSIPLSESFESWTNHVTNHSNFRLDSTVDGRTSFYRILDPSFSPFNIPGLKYQIVLQKLVIYDSFDIKRVDTSYSIYLLSIFSNKKSEIGIIKNIMRDFIKDFKNYFKFKGWAFGKIKGIWMDSYSFKLSEFAYTSFLSIYYSYSLRLNAYYMAIELHKIKDEKVRVVFED